MQHRGEHTRNGRPDKARTRRVSAAAPHLFFFLFLLCSLLMQCMIPLHNGIHFLLQSGFIELQLAILHFLIFYLNLHRNMKALFKDITYQ